MPNAEKLFATLQWCKDHPDKVDLETWYCNTTACFAGHAAFLNGAKPVFDSAGREVYETTENEYDISPLVDTPDGRRTQVHKYAKEVLEIDEFTAESLFYRDSLEDIERTIGELLA